MKSAIARASMLERVAFVIAGLAALVAAALPARAQSISPAEARAIAKEAYIYGFPMVDNYRIQYAYFVDTKHPEYKAPWNQIRNIARVYTPADRAIQTPNADTPYSMAGLDLRSEPIVLTVPKVEAGRYYSIQLIDAYTFNFAYIGSRATGNGAGSFLVAGPNWKGKVPKGIKQLIRSETDFVLAAYRTQLFRSADIANVKKVQAGYKVRTLSAFLGRPTPKAAPAIDFIKPLSPADQKVSLEYFNILDFLLDRNPPHPSEKMLRARFERIGLGAPGSLDTNALEPELKAALQQGMADAWADFAGLKKLIDAGAVTASDLLGSREHLRNNYLHRMAGTVLGIYGASREEAMYPVLALDSEGQKLDGANRYTVRFAPGELPAARAFWSLTMYEMPASQLVANPIDRYLINSPMLPDLVKDADGGITLYVQNESPGKDKEPNWLPAPKGPFMVVMRIYWPKPEALDGKWKAPPLVPVND